MKANKKMINTAAGVFFFLRAASGVSFVIEFVTELARGGHFYYYYGDYYWILLGQALYETVVLSAMAVYAFRQKKRGRLLNSLGIAYIIFDAVNIGFYGFSGLLSTAILIAAFVLTWKSNAGFVMEPKSEAVKAREQAQMQASLYAQQLQEGILTREEYNQLVKRRK